MSEQSISNACPYCEGAMRTTRKACPACRIAIDAEFADEPLGRLPAEHQRFIEMFVLAGGSLKEIAAQAGVSYPTVRNRLDKVIEQLRTELIAESEQPAEPVEQSSPTAAEIIKNI